MKMLCGVVAQKYEWQDEPTYNLFRYHAMSEEGREQARRDWASSEYIHLCDVEVEFEELDDGTFRARQIESLRIKRDALALEFQRQQQKVNERINNLLAIEGERFDHLPRRGV